VHGFTLFAPEKPPYAVERHAREGSRLEAMLDRLLVGRDHFLASGYSVVDIAFFGWLWCAVHQGFGIGGVPHLSAWYDRVAARQAVGKGITVPLPLPDFARFRA
jgi:GST-like protein